MPRFLCAQCGRLYSGPGNCASDGESLVLPSDPLLGEEVGRWRLARVVGSGGMGRVYLGVQPAIGSQVAIKVLSEECARDPELIERFFSEARAVNLIRHEHIVSVIDLDRLPDGRPYIVMEYLMGATLGELSRRGELTLPMVTHAVAQALGALAAAHRLGIVHRDLKPDNIFVTRLGIAKVLDFGIAKLAPGLLAAQSPRTKTGALLGTPEYMAPEQITSEIVDGRTDIYACGVMLYELVTGSRPFPSGNLFELMRAHIEQQPTPIRALRPDVPPEFEAVIGRALAKNPADRFPNAESMGRALVDASFRVGGPSWPGVLIGTPRSGATAPSTTVPDAAPSGFERTLPGPAPSPMSPPSPPWAASPMAPSPAVSQGPFSPGPHAPSTVANPTARTPKPRGWRVAAGLLLAGGVVGLVIFVAVQSGSAPTAATQVALATADGVQPPADATLIAVVVAPSDAAAVAAFDAQPPPLPSGPSGGRVDAAPAGKRIAAIDAAPVKALIARAGAGADANANSGPVLEQRDSVIIRSGVTIGPGVIINGQKRPTLVQKPNFDPRRFDAVAYISDARALARRLLPDAELTTFQVEAVGKSGAANLSLRKGLEATYYFRSKSASPRPANVPKGIDVDIPCMVHVEVTAHEVEAYVATREKCIEPFVRRPRCSLAAVWQKAITMGAPADHVAKIDLLHDGWYVQFGDDWSESIPDNC